jgi:hypothetical protein
LIAQCSWRRFAFDGLREERVIPQGRYDFLDRLRCDLPVFFMHSICITATNSSHTRQWLQNKKKENTGCI